MGRFCSFQSHEFCKQVELISFFFCSQVPQSIFAANSKEMGSTHDNPKLLRCRECSLTVHASCYGVTVLPVDLQNWACDVCKAGMVNRVVSIYY